MEALAILTAVVLTRDIYIYQITSDIIAPGLDQPSGRSHFHTEKALMVPSAAVVSGKKKQPNQQNPTPLGEVVMIQAWNLEY